MDTHTVTRLLQRARDGLGLCEDALGELNSARVRALVAQAAEAKRELIGSLHWWATYHRWLIVPTGTISGFAANLWTNLQATVSDDEDVVYLRGLRDREWQFELAFDDALRSADDPVLNRILQYHAPRLRACSEAVGDVWVRLDA